MPLSRLWLVLAVALPVLAGLIAPLPTVDLTYHLRAGAEILVAGAVPTVDTWTFTATGEPWVDQQWGAQVVLHLVERVGGWTGLVMFRAVLLAVIVGLLALIARSRGLDSRAAAMVALAAFLVASPAMALRPQLLGMTCFVVVLLLIAFRRRHRALIWLAPVVIAIWANVHGSFFLGPLALGLAWLEGRHERADLGHDLLFVSGAGALAACLTPFGPTVWVYALSLSIDPEVTARISEWQPTSLRTGPGLLFFASAAAVALLIARRGRPVPWPTLAWLAVFLGIGLYAERGVAWWPLAAVPVVATLLGGGRRRTASDGPARMDPPLIRRVNLGLVGVLVAAGVVLIPVWRPVDTGTGAPVGVLSYAPSGITAHLRDVVRPGDRLLGPQVWGSWFEHAVPQAKVAIDSRIELFSPSVWDEYEAVIAGVDGWQARLGSWGVTLIVTRPSSEALADRLRSAGWSATYSDADGTVFARPDRTTGTVTSDRHRLDSSP